MFLLYFKFNKSFPKILIIKPIGVTTKKNINPITNGEIIFPKNIPNLNQILLRGVSILEFISPNIRKIKDTAKDHILNSPLFINGYKAIKKKTIKKLFQTYYLS